MSKYFVFIFFILQEHDLPVKSAVTGVIEGGTEKLLLS